MPYSASATRAQLLEPAAYTQVPDVVAGADGRATVNPAGSWPQTPAEVVDRLPLLTAAEEVELAHAIEAGVLAGERLELARADVVDDPLLEQELCALVQLGAQAHERMVLANLRLVHSWARRRLGRVL